MDTEDVNDAMTLLEKVINSDIFDIKINTKNSKIKGAKIVNKKKPTQARGKKSSSNDSSSRSTSSRVTDSKSKSSYSNSSRVTSSKSDSSVSSPMSITGDSLTVKQIYVPSEIFIQHSSNNRSDSHYNLALSGTEITSCDNLGKITSCDNLGKIINIQ
jgi:hypothetical protein